MSFPGAAQSDLLGLHQRSACARHNRKPGLLRVFYALLFCRLGHHFFEGVHRAEAVIIDRTAVQRQRHPLRRRLQG